MIPTVCALNYGVSPLLLPTVCALNSGVSPLLAISSGISHSQRRIASSFCSRSSWKPLPNLKLSSSLGIASKPFLHGQQSSSFHAIPILPNRRLLTSPPRESTNEPQGSGFPLMTSEPRFWWRILACIPYLLSFQEIWFFAETARYFVQDYFKFCNCPLLISLGRIPRWFSFAYLFVASFGVVNRKEWPHFFRFHVSMSLVLELLFLIAGTLTQAYSAGSLTHCEGSLTQYLSQSLSQCASYCWKSSPELYWGKIGMHFWVFISFAFMVVVLDCMRCALRGMHPDVPFLSHMVEQDISDRDAGTL